MRTATAAAVAAFVLVLAVACGQSSSPPPAAAPSVGASGAAPVSASDAWVKATARAPGASAPGNGAPTKTAPTTSAPTKTATAMTAAFVTLRNSGEKAVTLVSASTPVARRTEIHETVSGTMRRRPGGLTIAPGATVALHPGGDHVMLLDLTKPLAPGDEVPLTLTFDGGPPVTVTAPVKSFVGADEPYPGHGASPSG